MKKRKFIIVKYKIAWYIGAVFSFMLYFSGIVPLYMYLRRRLKQHIAIVLTYHRVNAEKVAPDITVSADSFKRQVRYLRMNFDVVSIDEMIKKYICNNVSLERDTVAVTFDDGFKDNYTHAYPIFKKYNVPATVFVAIDYTKRDYGLNEDEIRIMQKGNITFGAHTITHSVLADLDRQSASLEIAGSKSALEEVLGEEVKYFAYPYGKSGRDFIDESVEIVKKAGFIAAFSTDNGHVDKKSDLFSLHRIGIRNFPLFVFKCRVSGIFENRVIHLLRRLIGL
jgi:peptidoglycan/xylan/chitin deacetylase (PgdA/CDA1 family)